MNSPRTELGESLAHQGGFTLNIGAGKNGSGDVRIDLLQDAAPDIRADACNLPFRDSTFSQVLLLDVIEHTPKKSEPKVVSEIHRVLARDGRLVLSTPNDRTWFKYLDPAYYHGHRHYTVEQIKAIIDGNFRIMLLFTAGGLIATVSNLFAMGSRYTGRIGVWQSRFSKKEYSRHSPNNGYTIFMVCLSLLNYNQAQDDHRQP